MGLTLNLTMHTSKLPLRIFQSVFSSFPQLMYIVNKQLSFKTTPHTSGLTVCKQREHGKSDG